MSRTHLENLVFVRLEGMQFQLEVPQIPQRDGLVGRSRSFCFCCLDCRRDAHGWTEKSHVQPLAKEREEPDFTFTPNAKPLRAFLAENSGSKVLGTGLLGGVLTKIFFYFAAFEKGAK